MSYIPSALPPASNEHVRRRGTPLVLAAVFLLVSAFFCYRSFYGMRIGERIEDIKA